MHAARIRICDALCFICFIIETFSGPSGLRDHRTATQHEFQMVGEADRSTEVTSGVAYLNRTAPGQEFPKAKNGQVGEIGWVYDTHKVVKGI